jgi:cytochrome c peroxidase
MKKVSQGGVQLTIEDKADLKAFLRSLSDFDFIDNLLIKTGKIGEYDQKI